MDALINSDLVQMPGPLAFYAGVAAFTLILFNLVVRLGGGDERPEAPAPSNPYELLIRLGEGDKRTPAKAPARPDPYEIAYLRDGVEAVIGVAIYALKRRGAIAVQPNGRLFALPGGYQPPDPIEAEVLGHIGAGARGARLLGSPKLRRAVESLFAVRKARLDGEGLLIAPAYRLGVNAFAFALGLGLAALAIGVAHSDRNPNARFLVVAAIAALLGLWASARVVTGGAANARGKAYLERIKLAFPYSSRNVGGGGLDASATLAALAMVGAHGFGILRDGPDGPLAEQMRR